LLTKIQDKKLICVNFYLEAYDYFCDNPNDFDGATIVKNLNIIPNLDIWAMIHDYIYIKYNVSSNIKYKWYADLIYATEMEKMGCSAYSTWSRFIGLTIFGGLLYSPITYLKGIKMTKQNKINILDLYTKFKTN
jgi:hypothetical protein